MLCQSGDSAVRASEMSDALYITAGADPYELLAEGFASVAERLGTFKVRSQKSTPGDIEKFGWCTWDVRANAQEARTRAQQHCPSRAQLPSLSHHTTAHLRARRPFTRRSTPRASARASARSRVAARRLR